VAGFYIIEHVYERREGLASGSDALSTAEILDWLERLADVDQGESEADCIDRLNALERLKSAAAAAQARVTGNLEARRDPDHRTRTNPGLGNEVALTRGEISERVLRDGSAQVTAVVSDVHYAAIVASLTEAAARARAAGDDRTRGQVMADLFVSRLTGQVTAQATPVAVKLVVSAETLLGDSSEPAQVSGAGVIPASVAREMAGAAAEVRSTIQRLFRFPETGTLVAMERGVRRFPAALREFIALRDQRCRTPWCNAPIQHTDHPVPARDGGATSIPNGQGLCEACNYAKEASGWSERPVGEHFEAHTVEITTPTGHVHRSREPGLPFPRSLPRPRTRLEAAFCDLILTV
jgi:hypothetical protein